MQTNRCCISDDMETNLSPAGSRAAGHGLAVVRRLKTPRRARQHARFLSIRFHPRVTGRIPDTECKLPAQKTYSFGAALDSRALNGVTVLSPWLVPWLFGAAPDTCYMRLHLTKAFKFLEEPIRIYCPGF